MDILEALKATPGRGVRRCRLGLWLDGIPIKQSGRDELARLVETPHDPRARLETRSAQNMAVVLHRLGLDITANPILDHRNQTCRCYR